MINIRFYENIKYSFSPFKRAVETIKYYVPRVQTIPLGHKPNTYYNEHITLIHHPNIYRDQRILIGVYNYILLEKRVKGFSNGVESRTSIFQDVLK